MMCRKILGSLVVIIFTLPAFAQYQGPHSLLQGNSFSLRGLKNHIVRLLTPRQPLPDNPWITAIKKTSANAQIPHGYLGIHNLFSPAPTERQETLTPQQQQIYKARIKLIQQVLRVHPYYGHYYYQPSAPRKSDLIRLTPGQFEQLLAFLRQPVAYKDTQALFAKLKVESHKHHIVKVTLPNNLYVFFECFRKKVYIVTNPLDIVNLPQKDTFPGDEFIKS